MPDKRLPNHWTAPTEAVDDSSSSEASLPGTGGPELPEARPGESPEAGGDGIARPAAHSGTSADLAHGQIVIVTARWILVLAGLLLTLWDPGPIGELRITLVVIFLLAGANFYLHAQLLMRRPTVDAVAYAASAADIAVITTLIATQAGFRSNLFVFYFPAILAFSVAFRTEMTFIFAGTATILYALVAAQTATNADADAQVLLARLLTLGAVAACGNVYWRIEGERRGAAMAARKALLSQVDVGARQS